MLDRTPEDWNRWLEEFSANIDREGWRGIQCFLRWIQVRAQNGHTVPDFLPGLEGDIFHSMLLRRLLSGKDPLPFPPPESFGKAWYELIETGQAEGVEVRPWEWAPEVKIAINQGIWTILEKTSDTDVVVTYREGGERFRLSKRGDGTWGMELLPG
ncbi:MAG: hypothetical protein K8T89_21555 [Planctomycetes bacterium]|nr:hypothetical protein [Planctomycetota bacterium]